MAEQHHEDDSAGKKKPNRLSRKRVAEPDKSETEAEVIESSQDTKSRTKRQANWTTRETNSLITNVLANYDILQANHSGSERTETEKTRVWGTIVDAVNA